MGKQTPPFERSCGDACPVDHHLMVRTDMPESSVWRFAMSVKSYRWQAVTDMTPSSIDALRRQCEQWRASVITLSFYCNRFHSWDTCLTGLRQISAGSIAPEIDSTDLALVDAHHHTPSGMPPGCTRAESVTTYATPDS
jgi:hypothetical protein